CRDRGVSRGGGRDHGLDAGGRDGRSRRGGGQAGGEPAGVARGGAGGGPLAVDDLALHAVLLEEPGGGQADHAGADDGDLLGWVGGDHDVLSKPRPRGPRGLPPTVPHLTGPRQSGSPGGAAPAVPTTGGPPTGPLGEPA